MDDDILHEFVLESTEALDHLDVELVALEDDPTEALLSSIFRRVHTIKGTCGFLGFARLERITHVGETLLSRLRDGELVATPGVVTALLRLVDAVREILEHVVRDGTEGTEDHEQLVADLNDLAALPSVTDDVDEDADATPDLAPPACDGAQTVDGTSGVAAGADSPRLGDRLVAAGLVSEADVDRAMASQVDGDPRHIGEILVGWGLVTPDQTLAVLEVQRSAQPATTADTTVRVDVAVLDELMDLVGELVLNRNALLQQASDDDALRTRLQRLDVLTSELQGNVVRTRMQPIDQLWAKYPRVVRDLARQCDKPVALEVEGGATELDKTVLDAVRDPVAHLVRNAVDHGLEAPAERAVAGKPATGTVTLRASHEAGQVVIEVSDDGRGIDPTVVGPLAVQRGIVSSADLATLSDGQITELLFAPGFSTADEVTTVSGRGVGMDVVRTDIERIGGTVEVVSQPGAGTTVRVRIPLTLAIIPALLVGSGTETYAIPQAALVELHRLRPGELSAVHEAAVLRLRDELVPVVHLDRVLHGPQAAAAGDHVVLLRAGDRTFGLVVDAVHDTAEIVVKALSRQLRDVPVYAGATVTGDGAVVLLLDAAGIAQTVGLSQVVAVDRDTDRPDAQEVATGPDEDTTRSLVLFRLAGDRRFALPLDHVARLEEFPAATVERSGIHDVVQRRGSILPLLHLGDVLPGGRRPPTGDGLPVRTIVYRRGGAEIGLVVGAVDDVVHQEVTVRRDLDVPGLAGSAVIDGVVTDVVDVETVLDRLGLLSAPA